jgi:hypothetical protein
VIDALAITTGSVVGGAVLGGLTRRKHAWFGSLRTFAVAAVATAVAVQMLPEAVAPLGGWGLVVFVAAVVAPGLLAPVFRRFGRVVSRHGVGTELGFIGFLLHQAAEGIALGTYASPEHVGHGHGSLYWAVAAHTVPLSALLIAEALVHGGRRAAVWRTVALAGATLAGFALADVVGQSAHDDVHPWISAAIAGFLVHVMFHDHDTGAKRTKTSSTLEVVALGIGVALPIFAALHGGDAHANEMRNAVATAFVELLEETAPMLLLGLLLGALLQLFGTKIPARYFTSGGTIRQALRGVVVGAPLPLCACGVLPIAESLRKRGAGPALVMAFLIATPELGPETLTLTIRFLGWPYAIVRLAAALALAFVAAVLFAHAVERLRRAKVADPVEQPLVVARSARGQLVRAGYSYLDELVLHTAPWTFVGLLAAAYVQAALPSGSLATLADNGVDVLVIALVAMPAYVCAASATPLAAVLLLKGVSPGAVLVGLLLGPATNIATVGVLRRAYGNRAVLVGVVLVAGLSIAMGYAVNLAEVPVHLPERLEEIHEHGWLSLVSVVLLGGVLVVQLWRWGTKPWFEILSGTHDHDHGRHHDHDHGHHRGSHEHQH